MERGNNRHVYDDRQHIPTPEEISFIREIKRHLSISENTRGTRQKKLVAIELYNYILSHTSILVSMKRFVVTILKKLDEFYCGGHFTWAEYKRYYLPIVNIFSDLVTAMPMMPRSFFRPQSLSRFECCAPFCACHKKREGEYFIKFNF